jgi:hypothetical protein
LFHPRKIEMSDKKRQPRREPTTTPKKKGRDYERAFFCCKRALAHAMNKNHELKTDCAGCLEIIGFLEIPGYDGDKHNPVGVDFDRPC